MIDMFQRQLALLFGHHVGSDMFGNGVIVFPRWFRHKYPRLQLHTMDRQVGNRHGIVLKHSMVHYTMFDAYREWCAHLQFEVKDEHALHFRCGSKLRCIEMKGAIRARAICDVKVCVCAPKQFCTFSILINRMNRFIMSCEWESSRRHVPQHKLTYVHLCKS